MRDRVALNHTFREPNVYQDLMLVGKRGVWKAEITSTCGRFWDAEGPSEEAVRTRALQFIEERRGEPGDPAFCTHCYNIHKSESNKRLKRLCPCQYSEPERWAGENWKHALDLGDREVVVEEASLVWETWRKLQEQCWCGGKTND